VNDFIARHGNKYDFDFADAIIKDFEVTVTVDGIENIPEKHYLELRLPAEQASNS